MTNIEQASATRSALRAKLDDARKALDEIDAKRKEIAYAAHVDGGEAKKALDRLNRERAEHVASIDSLETAILVASRRVEDAERGI